MLNDNDNSSGGGKELLVSDKELETKTALVMVQKCSKSSSHASLGLHTTTADGPDVLSGVYLASPEVVTKDCKQCCPSFSVRSASPSSKSESRKPKLFTWSDYSSVGIAAVAAVAVAGSLFLAFGRRRR
jgi:hypothetical protein